MVLDHLLFFVVLGKSHVKCEVGFLINDYLLLCKDSKEAMMSQYAISDVSTVIDTKDIFLRRDVLKSEDSAPHVFGHSDFEEVVHGGWN